MPFNDQQLKTLPLDLFGGLCTEESPNDLPEGASPDNQDCEFIPGSVMTRRGLQTKLSGLTGNVNYTKSYIGPTQDVGTLCLDSNGDFQYEDVTNNPGVLNAIGTVKAGCFAKSVTAFAREYIAFSDQNMGIFQPMQYDGTFFDRVSQDGPGAPPSVQDEQGPLNIIASPNGAEEQVSGGAAIAAGPNGATEVGNIVTLKMSVAASISPGLQPGDTVKVAGVGVGGYNGTFTVISIAPDLSSLTYFNSTTGLAASGGGTVSFSLYAIFTTVNTNFGIGTGVFGIISPTLTPQPTVTVAGVGVGGYNGTWVVRQSLVAVNFVIVNIPGVFSLANSGNGTLQIVGNISAGKHEVSVIFVTRQGYLTRPSVPGSWTAGGSLRAVVSNIATGPSNVVARILAFTPAASTFFFYIPTGPPNRTMVIPDNTTTSLTIDFTDITLEAATSIDTAGNNLFALVTLAECLGVFSFADRTAWWGERNKLNNFLNLMFDGGWSGNVPLGWTEDTTNGAGGSRDSTNVLWGDAYRITGDGATAIRGMITQGAYQDFYNIPIILPNTPFSIRVNLLKGGGITTGNAVLQLFSSSAGSLATFTVPVASISSTAYTEFISTWLVSTPTIPIDLTLRVYMNGTPTNGGWVDFENIQIFPTSQPFLQSQARVSYVNNPESFDGVTGRIALSEAGTQAIRTAFQLNENLYLRCDDSLFVTSDNGTTEPSGWSVSQRSNTSGTPSVNGSAIGEEWEVSLHRTGVYMFSGGEPLKLNQEIFNDGNGLALCWDKINWDFGQTAWIQNDVMRRQIYIGVPLGAATSPSKIFMLDYKELQTAGNIASEGPIHTSYSGKVISWEPGRKWSPWNIASASGAMIRRQDGTDQLFVGNGVGNGKIYQPVKGQFSDDGVAIDSYYTTYFMPSSLLEQGLQLGSNRKFWSFLGLAVTGSGVLIVTPILQALGNSAPQYNLVLQSPSTKDTECPVHAAGERIAFRIETNAVGSWWQLSKLYARTRPHAWSRIRHAN